MGPAHGVRGAWLRQDQGREHFVVLSARVSQAAEGSTKLDAKPGESFVERIARRCRAQGLRDRVERRIDTRTRWAAPPTRGGRSHGAAIRLPRRPHGYGPRTAGPVLLRREVKLNDTSRLRQHKRLVDHELFHRPVRRATQSRAQACAISRNTGPATNAAPWMRCSPRYAGRCGAERRLEDRHRRRQGCARAADAPAWNGCRPMHDPQRAA